MPSRIRVRSLITLLAAVATVACKPGRATARYIGPPRPPTDAHVMGRGDTAWGGRVVVTRSTLVFEFPVTSPDLLGCSPEAGDPHASRSYRWGVAASYRGSTYPDNHSQSLGVRFTLPADGVPTRARVDSALATVVPLWMETRGEPPSIVDEHGVRAVDKQLEAATIDNHSGTRMRFVLRDRQLAQRFLATGASDVSFAWCQNGRLVAAYGAPIQWP